MARSQSFSIYLLKSGYDSSNSLKSDHSLSSAINPTNIPADASLFILDAPPKEPWWKSYFGVQESLLQQYKGALVFISKNSRCFALAFGQVSHFLEESCYEYDFGIRVTLNSLDPKEIRSADMVDPGVARRKRTQVPNSTELTYLDFDSNSEIIKSLTGKVKAEYKDLFVTATGASSLKINLKNDPDDLPDVCQRLFDLYSSNQYEALFPNIQNILPIRDPGEIVDLDNALINALNARNFNVSLAIPEIVDYSDVSFCRFVTDGVFGDLYGDISVESLYTHLDERGGNITFTIEKIKRDRLYLTDGEGNIRRSFSIYRDLLFDVVMSGPSSDACHLCEGNWYRVNAGFAQRLVDYIDNKCEDSSIIDYYHDRIDGNKVSYSEENYNLAVSQSNGNYICLDQTDISPSGNTQIEPCDIYTAEVGVGGSAEITGIFYHIKISTRSSQLSHLFNQGVNSIEILKMEEESRSKLRYLVTERTSAHLIDRFVEPIYSGKFKVVFGIITDKPKANKSANLPLFSKISLIRNMIRLNVMSVASSLIFIEDTSGNKTKLDINKYIDVEIQSAPDGKVVVVPSPGQWYVGTAPIDRCPKALKNNPIGSRFKIRVEVDAAGDLYTDFRWAFTELS